jgi:predicted RNA binding protein YcfA (HicA-like mRNA interferase family)
VKPRLVIRALKRNGFIVDRTSGSHYLLMKGKLSVIVPYHTRDLKPGTLSSIIKQADLTIEEFLELL